MALALARKYRPKRFADVAVQQHVSATLQGAIERGRVAHGYLLCGPRGVGKTTLARVLAMALNCQNPQSGEPCGECESCRRIWSGASSLDVVEIDAASNRGVDDARQLRERAMYAPSSDEGYKVYIVDEAHMLTREAWNALLKILEEPPPRVVFVFATTEPQRIATTAAPVLSRLQRFDFKRIGPAEIRARLTEVLGAEEITAEPDAVATIARAADGSMRDALSLTDQALSMGDGALTAARVRDALGLVPEDEFLAVVDLLAERRAANVFPLVARLAEAGVDFGGFLNGIAEMLRAQLAIVLGGSVSEISEGARDALEAGRHRFSAGDLLRMLAVITEIEPRFKKSGQQQLLLETLLVRLALMDHSVELQAVLQALGQGSASGPGAGGSSAGSSSTAPRQAGKTSSARQFHADGAERHDAAPARRSLGTVDGSVSSPPWGQAPTASLSVPEPVAGASSAQPALRVPAPLPQRPSSAPLEPLDLSRLTGRWEELIERVRASSKPLLATALQRALPKSVNARGEIIIELEEPNDFYAHALSDGRAELARMLREWFSGVERVQIARAADADDTPARPQKRMTDDMVRAERLAALRKRDPVLAAAIDALDLDVAD
jgi:DNA polymerase-3 subunit gamma/tau